MPGKVFKKPRPRSQAMPCPSHVVDLSGFDHVVGDWLFERNETRYGAQRLISYVLSIRKTEEREDVATVIVQAKDPPDGFGDWHMENHKTLEC